MTRLQANPTLRPERALLAPSWITALALLALNDHWLKYAGLLPGWLTGKLSDFAGLYLAPALLAALLRVRTRGQLFACHVAVSAVFAAINLDPRCAALWARLMGALGFEWHIVVDAADLIALPAAVLAWFALLPAMHAGAVPPRARRAAQHALSGVGVLLCMATSQPGEGGWFSRANGPHLHNTASRHSVAVLVRALRPTVLLDCDAIADNPGALLPDAAFDVASVYELGPRENIPLPVATTQTSTPVGVPPRGCHAVLLGGAGLRPAVVFWRDDDEFAFDVPSEYTDDDELQPGAVEIVFDGEYHTGFRDDGDFVFELEPLAEESLERCAATDEAARPALSVEVRSGTWQLTAVDEGPDGCIALRTRAMAGAQPGPLPSADAGVAVDDEDAGVPDPDVPDPDDPEPAADPGFAADAYVCLPRGMFPFRAGDVVEIEVGANAAGSLRMSTRDASGLAVTELLVGPLHETHFFPPLDLEVRRDMRCSYTLSEGCAQTATAAEVDVTAGGETIALRAGDTQHFSARGVEVQVALPISQYRVLIDSECATGQPSLGGDAVLVAVLHYADEEAP